MKNIQRFAIVIIAYLVLLLSSCDIESSKQTKTTVVPVQKASKVTIDDMAPTVAVPEITISGRDRLASTITLSWNEAADDISTLFDIEYLVAYSDEDNISTVDEILDNGTIVSDFSLLTSATISGFEGAGPYYFNVIARDAAGNTTAYSTLNVSLWARTASGTGMARFSSIATDSSSNIYAAGFVMNSGTYSFGEDVSVTGLMGTYNLVIVKYDQSGSALWAKTVTTGLGASQFLSLATDSSGNIYAVGYISGTTPFTFGDGVSVAGTDVLRNVVLVKYDSHGNAQWAKTVIAGTDESQYNSVSVDNSGNVYAAGSITGTGTYTFGTGVSDAGTFNGGGNIILVKYNSLGTALWARSLTAGTNTSVFTSVTVDTEGNVYASGFMYGAANYTFATGVSVAGSSTNSNAIIVKYNASGTAQWARSVTTGEGTSRFNSLAVDRNGSVYAAGNISGVYTYTFGNGVTVTGSSGGNPNIALVKYNSNGNAEWSRTHLTGTNSSSFESVMVDDSDNIYAAGHLGGTGQLTFDVGVSVSAATPSVLLVQYDATGTARKARTVTTGTNNSEFYSVTRDSSGNLYASGELYGIGTYIFDTGVSITGTGPLLVQY